jgi:molybdenum cofactor biosynthesis protein B
MMAGAGPDLLHAVERVRAASTIESEAMAGIDESLMFHPLRIAVLTVSDTRTAATDKSGDLLVERLTGAGHDLVARALVPDEVDAIRGQVRAWVEAGDIEVVLTTGGTGFSPRDVTPEALKPLFRREMDGFSVLMHQASTQTVGVSTLQSRACAGQIGDAFVFCLPGSPGACRDAWDFILSLELDSRYRPCSLAGMVPRLRDVCV